MLPDFHSLRQRASESPDLRSLEHVSDQRFTLSQSSQQFSKEGDRTLSETDHHSKKEIDHQFFQLWLAQPSWSPIIHTKTGWITVKSNSKKQVPLTESTLKSYYRRDYAIGKRFGQLTTYLMIDIDINSPFHPNNGGFQSILTAMERIGLVRYLIIRSSASGGIHLYFPLLEPVNAWQLARTAHSALTANGVQIIGGQCELFPNKKSYNANFNGHRLPLQTGSFLLDEDCCPISNCKADFLHRWQTAATHQDEKTLQQALTGQLAFAPLTVPVEQSSEAPPQVFTKRTTSAGHVIPPIAWTRFGQSNDIMCELVNYGDRYVGLKSIDKLAAWVKAVAPQLPGYQQFASVKSKRDIEYGTWPTRWSKSHFNSVWKHKVGGSDHNANVAYDARCRIFGALDRICVEADIRITKLFDLIIEAGQRYFNKVLSWHTLKKYEAEIRAYIKRPGLVGLSDGVEEDVNSFSAEPLEAEIIEVKKEPRHTHTQLLTLRCAASIYGAAFASLHTSKSEVISDAKSEAELPDGEVATETVSVEALETAEKGGQEAVPQRKGLTIGQLVRIVMPGGSLNGVETKVVEQTVDVLGLPVYRLDYQRKGRAVTLPAECLQAVEQKDRTLPGETVIQATAAQLLQVLGKTCPFVGPGLWPVSRDEVSTKAWRQLGQLIREG